MKTEQIVRILSVVEHKFDVHDVRFGQIYAWPIIRYFLTGQLLDLVPQGIALAELKNNKVWVEAIEAIDRKYFSLGLDPINYTDRTQEYFTKKLSHFEESASGRRNYKFDGIFLSREQEHSRKLNTLHYAPITDPWFDCASKNHEVIKLEILTQSGSALPRYNPPIFVDIISSDSIPALDTKDATELLSSILDFLSDAYGIYQGSWYARTVPWVNTEENFKDYITSVYNFKISFDHYLECFKPKCVFTSNHEHETAIGAFWAANERQIKTIDLQHGTNGDPHYSYTHFTIRPNSGYEVHPKFFVTWGLRSANNIERHLSEKSKTANSLIGGRFDLVNAKLDKNMKVDFNILSLLALKYEKTTLVTMTSTGGRELFFDLALRIAISAPKNWLWIFRTHPFLHEDSKRILSADKIDEELKKKEICSFPTKIISNLPLGKVLEISNHHLTGYSSCIMEAHAMGVPTTFTDPLALQWHKGYLDANAAYLAKNYEDAIDTIKKGKSGLVGFDEFNDVITDVKFADDLLEALFT